MNGITPARVARLACALVAAMSLIAVTAAIASAHAVKTKQPFTIQYASSAVTSEGEVVCKGFHETNSELFPGSETEGGRDKEKCRSTTHMRFTALTGGEESSTFPGTTAYESDWFYLKGERGATIESTKMRFAVKASDKTFTLLIYFPFEGVYPPTAP